MRVIFAGRGGQTLRNSLECHQVVYVLEGTKIGVMGREILVHKMIQQYIAIVGIVARGMHLQEGADVPSMKNWSAYGSQSASLLQKLWCRVEAWGGYQALHRLANGTKGNRSTTTINHNRSTVGGGGLGGAVILITEILHYVALCGCERKNNARLIMAMHVKAMWVDK